MSRSLPIPYFPNPPLEYDARYLSEVVRAFSLYAQQAQNPGDLRATTLILTDLQTDDYNLAPGSIFQQDGFLKISLLYLPHPRGASVTAGVGAVTVTIS